MCRCVWMDRYVQMFDDMHKDTKISVWICIDVYECSEQVRIDISSTGCDTQRGGG